MVAIKSIWVPNIILIKFDLSVIGHYVIFSLSFSTYKIETVIEHPYKLL